MASELETKTIYTKDEGVVLEVDCEVDVSDAADVFILTREEGDNSTLLKHTASLSPGETDKIRFTIALANFTDEGIYEAKSYVEFSGSHKQQGRFTKFRIETSWPLTAT